MSLPAPVHVTQRDGSPWAPYGCMGAVGAMALDAFTGGRVRVSMHEVRRNQDDQAGGIGLDDVATAWSRGWGLTFSQGARSWDQVRARLAAGDGAAVTINYGRLGSSRAPGSSFTGPHALYLQSLTPAGIVTNDPLRSGPVTLPESVVRAAYAGSAGWGIGATATAGPGDQAGVDQLYTMLRGKYGVFIGRTYGAIITGGPYLPWDNVPATFTSWRDALGRKDTDTFTDADLRAIAARYSKDAEDDTVGLIDQAAGALRGVITFGAVLVLVILGLYLVAKS